MPDTAPMHGKVVGIVPLHKVKENHNAREGGVRSTIIQEKRRTTRLLEEPKYNNNVGKLYAEVVIDLLVQPTEREMVRSGVV